MATLTSLSKSIADPTFRVIGEIREQVTNDIIDKAKIIIPSLQSREEKQRAMLEFATYAVEAFERKVWDYFKECSPQESELAAMLVNSSKQYFYSPRDFRQRVWESIE
ncbi:MAG: hypothetical protein H6620_09780 [Halobacteriovoraceae bacterium]|nr:hypothetical protein [Halobacteriovoraceae bacterium]